jgi:hypothetical protein
LNRNYHSIAYRNLDSRAQNKFSPERFAEAPASQKLGGAMADLYLALTISSAVALAFLSATLVLPAF